MCYFCSFQNFLITTLFSLYLQKIAWSNRYTKQGSQFFRRHGYMLIANNRKVFLRIYGLSFPLERSMERSAVNYRSYRIDFSLGGREAGLVWWPQVPFQHWTLEGWGLEWGVFAIWNINQVEIENWLQDPQLQVMFLSMLNMTKSFEDCFLRSLKSNLLCMFSKLLIWELKRKKNGGLEIHGNEA